MNEGENYLLVEYSIERDVKTGERRIVGNQQTIQLFVDLMETYLKSSQADVQIVEEPGETAH